MRLLRCAVVGLVLLLTACSGVPAPRLSASASARLPPGSVSPSAVRLDHIVVIVEENESSANLVGSSDAPYLSRLAAEYAVAANYSAVTHPSLPNYLALTSGTTAGITDDCNPPGGKCVAAVRNIADEIERSGRTWKMYGEGMPEPCWSGNSGRYAVKHNPFLYYPDVLGDPVRCRAHVVPFSQLHADLATESSLPDYVFISPDLCDDMHDCSVRTGDRWLATEVPNILGSPAFRKQNSLLVITWDESRGSSNRVTTVFAGPAAKRGYLATGRYTHYSLLRTVEDAWGLAPLTALDREAHNMNGMLAGPPAGARTPAQ